MWLSLISFTQGWKRCGGFAGCRCPPCSNTLPPWPRGASGRPPPFKAGGAVPAKVDWVAINAGIIGRKTWLQGGAGAITAATGLQLSPGVSARWQSPGQGQGQGSLDVIQPPGASSTPVGPQCSRGWFPVQNQFSGAGGRLCSLAPLGDRCVEFHVLPASLWRVEGLGMVLGWGFGKMGHFSPCGKPICFVTLSWVPVNMDHSVTKGCSGKKYTRAREMLKGKLPAARETKETFPRAVQVP